ncbi:hypothetical protein Tco_0049259 [Tanacetum coccineum]
MESPQDDPESRGSNPRDEPVSPRVKVWIPCGNITDNGDGGTNDGDDGGDDDVDDGDGGGDDGGDSDSDGYGDGDGDGVGDSDLPLLRGGVAISLAIVPRGPPLTLLGHALMARTQCPILECSPVRLVAQVA